VPGDDVDDELVVEHELVLVQTGPDGLLQLDPPAVLLAHVVVEDLDTGPALSLHAVRRRTRLEEQRVRIGADVAGDRHAAAGADSGGAPTHGHGGRDDGQEPLGEVHPRRDESDQRDRARGHRPRVEGTAEQCDGDDGCTYPRIGLLRSGHSPPSTGADGR
jgi:hypothetical protein